MLNGGRGRGEAPSYCKYHIANARTLLDTFNILLLPRTACPISQFTRPKGVSSNTGRMLSIFNIIHAAPDSTPRKKLWRALKCFETRLTFFQDSNLNLEFNAPSCLL